MPYLRSMNEIRMANKSWEGECDECETQMEANDKIIKMIRAHADCIVPTDALCLPFSKITSCSLHFHGWIKTRVQPLVKNMYGFIKCGKQRGIDHNVRLAHELKHKSAFVYAVCFCLIFHINTCSQGSARNIWKMVTEASTNTRSFRKQSTTYSSKTRRTMV